MAAGDDTFHAKIMLFGEYSLMTGSAALVMPHAFFSARLHFPDTTARSTNRNIVASNHNLATYCDYLSGLPDLPLRLQAFRTDIKNGLFLESDIPSGYGLGSSGALVAAVYKRYSEKKPGIKQRETDWMKLKDLFARMESFFHGSSSGIDPLCIYAGKSLLLDGQGHITEVSFPRLSGQANGGLFLVDTARKAETAPLVASFRTAYEQPAFAQMLQQEYIPLNDACIAACLSGDAAALGNHWNALSALQYTYFSGMIPDAFKIPWSLGLERKAYALKLCGSGGGGYLLGFTTDHQLAQSMLCPYEVIPVALFQADP
jgi:mevalonate kinase